MKASLIKFILLAMLVMMPSMVSAGSEHNMKGWAWSSNIGWISFNCLNDNSCGTVNYGVHLNPSSNAISGYAWSSNIGWIQFGGLSGFPTGGGTQAQNANLNGENLKGWAKALSADGNGWDGWISLSGAEFGVNLSGGILGGTNFVGYAWGGPVVGWMLFDTQSTGVCTDCGVTLGGTADLDVKSGGSTIVGRTDVTYGTVPTFEWNLFSMPSGTSCSVWKTSSAGTAFTTVTGITSSGSVSGSPLMDAAYTYKMECVKSGATTTTETVGFTVLPQPAGFSLGGSETMRIQFLASGSADSEQKGIFVTKAGNFSEPVTVSMTSFLPPMASTTYSYSLDGGQTYSQAPGPTSIISSPYTAGLGFKVRVVRLSGAPAFTGPYTITLTGTASGFPASTKNIIINPVIFDPKYEEL